MQRCEHYKLQSKQLRANKIEKKKKRTHLWGILMAMKI